MKIMTISASPYLLVRNAKINSAVLKYLKSIGHDVSSACWHHDEGYFLPEANSGQYEYEDDGSKICDLYPFIVHPEHSASQVYEIMKKVAPNVVITIGDHKETNFMYAIRSMYPVFKWISIVTIDAHNISESNFEFLNYADAVICLSKFSYDQLSRKVKQPLFMIPFGPDHSQFYINKLRNYQSDKMRILCTSKNALSNNLGNLIKAVSGLKEYVDLYLHSNIYDVGEYDIYNLIDIYNATNVILPEEYVSIKDGVSTHKMNDLYNSFDAIIDCSARSSTALSVLEAMSCGCLPIVSSYAALGEVVGGIIGSADACYRDCFMIDSFCYIGRMEEEFSICTVEGITNSILNMYSRIVRNGNIFKNVSEKCVEEAKKYDKFIFLKKLENAINQVISSESKIYVDSL